MASLGTWPAAIKPSNARFTMHTNQRVNAAPGGGSEQAVDLLNDRWMCELTLPPRYFRDGAAMEAFLNSFRGQVNTIDLWHFARPLPLGTLDGSPTLQAAASQGASSIVIATTAGKTVKAGDLVAVSSLLLMAAADATADGSGHLTMPLVNRLRKALSAGDAVTWNKPTAPFRLLAHSGTEYGGGVAGEVTMTLGEAI
jgi:predicted RecA/RadA family phage recombinase